MTKTYIPAFVVAVLLASFHFIATEGQWYVRYPGFDIFMHLLGGAAIALAVYCILRTFCPSLTPSFWKIVGLTFVAGVAWEAFETLYDIAGAPVGTHAYYIDSMKDLVNDTIGAAIASYFLKK